MRPVNPKPSPEHAMTLARLTAAIVLVVAVAGCKSPQEQIDLFCPTFTGVLDDRIIAPEMKMSETSRRWIAAGADEELMNAFYKPMLGDNHKAPDFWKKVHATHEAAGYTWSCPRFEKWFVTVYKAGS